MSLSLPICKLCHAQISWKDPLPVVGEDQQQRELAAGFLALVQHIAQKHADMRPHSQMWFAMFSEFYFLSMFTELPPILQTAMDLKRVQLLRTVQPKIDAFSVGSEIAESISVENRGDFGAFVADGIACMLEDRDLAVRLEAAGFKLSTGFLDESTLVKVA